MTSNEDGGESHQHPPQAGHRRHHGDTHNEAFGSSPADLDSGGPCITCHMGGITAGVHGADHTWGIEQKALDNVCSKCHAAEAADLAGTQSIFIEEQAVPFDDAVALAIATLKTKFNISYSDAYPYFFDDSLTTPAAVKDWTRGGTLVAADAKKLMGACLNIKLMKADPAAYVHSRSYARRVLYDTIDWLDDKTINLSTGTTALASGMKDASNNDVFTKGVKAYNVAWDGVSKYAVTTPYAGTSEAMLYLLAWSRSNATESIAGSWTTPERP